MTIEITASFIFTLIQIGITRFVFEQTVFKVLQIDLILFLIFIFLIVLLMLLINWSRWVKKTKGA